MKTKEHIQQNPYRVMGVCTTDPLSHISWQNSRMKAHAAINKEVCCMMDMAAVFGSRPGRQAEALSAANTALCSPMGRLTHGLFWFMSLTDTDASVLETLAMDGDLMAAEKAWEMDTGGMSSLQNRMVCCLLRGSRYYPKALRLASRLYATHGSAFIRLVSKGFDVITPDRLMPAFLAEVIRHSEGKDAQWEKAVERLGDETIALQWAEAKAEALIAVLRDALYVAKAAEIHEALDHYRIAIALKKLADPLLKSLRRLRERHPVLLSRYASIADEVCEEVTSRGISYHNRSAWFPGKKERVLELERFCYRHAMSLHGKRKAQENVNMSLGRPIMAPLFPNASPDRLTAGDRMKANAGIMAILNALRERKDSI